MLPAGSKTKSAIAMDEEMAELRVSKMSEEDLRKILEARAEKNEYDIELTPEDYSVEIEKYNQIIDAVNALRITVISALSGKGKSPEYKPAERPTTKYESKLKQKLWELDKQDAEDLISEWGF